MVSCEIWWFAHFWIPDIRAVEPLTKILEDHFEDYRTRNDAVLALNFILEMSKKAAKIEGKYVVEPLIEALKSDEEYISDYSDSGDGAIECQRLYIR